MWERAVPQGSPPPGIDPGGGPTDVHPGVQPLSAHEFHPGPHGHHVSGRRGDPAADRVDAAGRVAPFATISGPSPDPTLTPRPWSISPIRLVLGLDAATHRQRGLSARHGPLMTRPRTDR